MSTASGKAWALANPERLKAARLRRREAARQVAAYADPDAADPDAADPDAPRPVTLPNVAFLSGEISR